MSDNEKFVQNFICVVCSNQDEHDLSKPFDGYCSKACEDREREESRKSHKAYLREKLLFKCSVMSILIIVLILFIILLFKG